MTFATEPAMIYSPSKTGMPSFIEKWLLLPKLLFFFIGAINFCMGESITHLIFRTWQLPDEKFSQSVYRFVVSIIGSLVLSGVFDEFKKRRMILAASVIGYAVMILAFSFPVLWVSQDTRAFLLQLVYSCQYFFSAAFYPITNVLVLDKLVQDPKNGKDLYGRQRLFAPLGHLFISILLGRITIEYGTRNLGFAFHFCFLVFFVLAFLITLYFFDDEKQSVRNEHNLKDINLKFVDESSHDSDSFSSTIWKLLINPKFIILFIAFSIAALTNSYVENSLKPFIEILTTNNNNNNFNRKTGNSIILTSAAEVLIYCFYKNINQLFDFNWIIVAGHGLLILRTLAFANISAGNRLETNLFIINSVKGLSHAFIALANVRVASDMASSAISATSQSIFDLSINAIPALIVSYLIPMTFSGGLKRVRFTYVLLSIIGVIVLIPIAFFKRIFPRKVEL